MEFKNYPKNITKLNKLIICSNELIGGGDLIRLGNYIPLIIGSGNTPQIWINIKIGNSIIELIKENQSLNRQIKVEINDDLRETNILAENSLIISSKMIKDKECIVNNLDLRPIGLNIYGDATELNVSGVKLINSTFHGTSFLLGSN